VNILMMWIAAVVAVALIWWSFRRPARVKAVPEPGPDLPHPAAQAPGSLRAAAATPTPKAAAAVPATGAALPPVASAPPRAATAPAPQRVKPPPELARFEWLPASTMEPSRRDALLATLKGIPRPPHSLQRLLSPEFVAKAGSAELSELVMGEPLIAAKVLSTVNAPFYGLHKPVASIGQAVTFMGMNTVRGICLKYMLAEAFKPALASSQKVFDKLWEASAIANELCARLGKTLSMADQGALSTQVVLGFVGRLAVASLLPGEQLNEWLRMGRLQQAQKEQELLGLNAAEIGGLLMTAWELPAGLVAEVRNTDRVLITPAAYTDADQAPRLALPYLCALLGQRLALGQLDSLEHYDAFGDNGVDSFHLHGLLKHPALARLTASLHSAEMQTAVMHMLGKEVEPA
jgi:HD-like signal output (HDOD) protein